MMEPTGILCANCTHDLAWHHTNGNCKNACHCGGFVYSPELDGTREMAAENTRLDDALLATSNELTDATAQINELNEENRRLLAELEAAVHRAQEAEYAYTLLTKQADVNYKRAQAAEANLSRYQTVTVARRCKNEMACDGDGSGPGWCDHDAVWEIQRMGDDGSHYSYVCDGHLSDYQKWADGEGYAPLVFEND